MKKLLIVILFFLLFFSFTNLVYAESNIIGSETINSTTRNIESNEVNNAENIIDNENTNSTTRNIESNEVNDENVNSESLRFPDPLDNCEFIGCKSTIGFCSSSCGTNCTVCNRAYVGKCTDPKFPVECYCRCD